MSPALNGSPTLGRFECKNASEILNGIMFNFYLRLPRDTLHCKCQKTYIFIAGSIL